MYINLSEYYRDKGEGEVALEYAEKAAKAAKTNESRVASLLNKCEVLYSMKRINDFNACYDECTQVIEQYGVIRKTAVQRLHIYKLILNKITIRHILKRIPYAIYCQPTRCTMKYI